MIKPYNYSKVLNVVSLNLDEKIGQIGVTINSLLNHLDPIQNKILAIVDALSDYGDAGIGEFFEVSAQTYDDFFDLMEGIDGMSVMLNKTNSLLNVDLSDMLISKFGQIVDSENVFHITITNVIDGVQHVVPILGAMPDFDGVRYWFKIESIDLFNVFKNILDSVSYFSMLGQIVNLFSNGNLPSISDVKAILDSFPSLSEACSEIFQGLSSMIAAAGSNAHELARAFIEFMSQVLGSLKQLASGTFIDFVDYQWNLSYYFSVPVSGVLFTVVSLATSVIGIIASCINPVIGIALTGIGAAVTAIKNFISDHTHLTTCEINWLGCDASRAIAPRSQSTYDATNFPSMFNYYNDLLHSVGNPLLLKRTHLSIIEYIWKATEIFEHNVSVTVIKVERYTNLSWSPTLKWLWCQAKGFSFDFPISLANDTGGLALYKTVPHYDGGTPYYYRDIDWFINNQSQKTVQILSRKGYLNASEGWSDEFEARYLFAFYRLGLVTSDMLEDIFHNHIFGDNVDGLMRTLITESEGFANLSPWRIDVSLDNYRDTTIYDPVDPGYGVKLYSNSSTDYDFTTMGLQSCSWLHTFVQLVQDIAILPHGEFPQFCKLIDDDDIGSILIIPTDPSELKDTLDYIDRTLNLSSNFAYRCPQDYLSASYLLLNAQAGLLSWDDMYSLDFLTKSDVNVSRSLAEDFFDMSSINSNFSYILSTNIIGRGIPMIIPPSFSNQAWLWFAFTVGTTALITVALAITVAVVKVKLTKAYRKAQLASDVLAFSDDFASTDPTKRDAAFKVYRKSQRKANLLGFLSGATADAGGDYAMDYAYLAYCAIR